MLLLLLFRPACACIVQSYGLSFNHEFAEANGLLPAVVSIVHSITTELTTRHFAREDASAAIAVLESYRQQVEAKGWPDERLKALVLQALAFHAHVEKDNARDASVV
jgi:hypothetical protein